MDSCVDNNSGLTGNELEQRIFNTNYCTPTYFKQPLGTVKKWEYWKYSKCKVNIALSGWRAHNVWFYTWRYWLVKNYSQASQPQSSVGIGYIIDRLIDKTHQNIDSAAVLFGSIILYNIDVFSVPINVLYMDFTCQQYNCKT